MRLMEQIRKVERMYRGSGRWVHGKHVFTGVTENMLRLKHQRAKTTSNSTTSLATCLNLLARRTSSKKITSSSRRKHDIPPRRWRSEQAAIFSARACSRIACGLLLDSLSPPWRLAKVLCQRLTADNPFGNANSQPGTPGNRDRETQSGPVE